MGFIDRLQKKLLESDLKKAKKQSQKFKLVAINIQSAQAKKIKEKKEIENLKKQIQKARFKGLSKSQIKLLEDRKKKKDENFKKIEATTKKTLSGIGKGILMFAEAVDSYNKPLRKKRTTKRKRKK